MDRQSVTSSNLRSVGYDVDSQTLELEFDNGSIYQYYGVPEKVHRGSMQAPSKGSHLHQHIRVRVSNQRIL
jgi:hypothetical protein